MIETYYAGAYWLGRHEAAEACAQRAALFFRLLARCDPSFARWYEQAGSRAEALALPIEPNEATLLKLLAQKAQGPMGGFSLGSWNGEHRGSSSRLSLACGSPSRRTPNSCVLKPPAEGDVAARVLSASGAVQVLRAMVQAWDPEWGVVTSHAHSERASEFGEPGTFVGWVMYFARQRGLVPPLPASVRTEPVEDRGTLVVLTSERFSASNPEHVALAEQVHEVLAEAGLLRPLHPL